MTATDTELQPVAVGDFFEESWGYDQTNVDFYQVVKISPTGKTVWMRHVRAGVVRGGDGGPADYIAPIPDAFDEAGTSNRQGVLQKRLRSTGWNGARWSVNMTSYSDAYLWDCKPAFQTGYGWGH